jgi:hypothetical protein
MIIIGVLIVSGLSFLLIGEWVANKLPKDNSFVKWWRKHIVGELSDDDPHF